MNYHKIAFFSLLMFFSCAAYSEENVPAPDFRLQEFSKESYHSLSGLMDGNSVVVLNFFDTHCAPCRKEIPKLNSVYKTLPSNAKMMLICLDEKPENALPDFLKGLSNSIPVLSDPSGYRAGEKYGVIKYGTAEIPQIFVIGKDGYIKKQYKGLSEDIAAVLTSDIKHYLSISYSRPKSTSFSIIYSGSANGFLESCDCPQNPFGGLTRRVTMTKTLKEKHPNSIILDSGDCFPPRPDKLLTDYTVNMMSLIDYDMIGVGDQELLSGTDYLKENAKALPFSCANLQLCTDKMCFPFSSQPFIVKKFGSYRVAVLSITSNDIFFLFPKDKLKNVKLTGHIEYLKNIIPDIRKEADFLVLLSHSGNDDDIKIAESVKGIDLIIGGHSQTFNKEPVKVNDTLIVQGGQNGHRIGVISFNISPDRKTRSFSNTFYLLDKDIKDDPDSKKLLESYKNALKEKSRELTR